MGRMEERLATVLGASLRSTGDQEASVAGCRKHSWSLVASGCPGGTRSSSSLSSSATASCAVRAAATVFSRSSVTSSDLPR